jgi:hypothetical protein
VKTRSAVVRRAASPRVGGEGGAAGIQIAPRTAADTRTASGRDPTASGLGGLDPRGLRIPLQAREIEALSRPPTKTANLLPVAALAVLAALVGGHRVGRILRPSVQLGRSPRDWRSPRAGGGGGAGDHHHNAMRMASARIPHTCRIRGIFRIFRYMVVDLSRDA